MSVLLMPSMAMEARFHLVQMKPSLSTPKIQPKKRSKYFRTSVGSMCATTAKICTFLCERLSIYLFTSGQLKFKGSTWSSANQMPPLAPFMPWDWRSKTQSMALSESHHHCSFVLKSHWTWVRRQLDADISNSSRTISLKLLIRVKRVWSSTLLLFSNKKYHWMINKFILLFYIFFCISLWNRIFG